MRNVRSAAATAAAVVCLVSASVPAGAWGAADAPPDSGLLLYVNEGNRMRRIDVDTIGTGHLVQDVFIMSAADEIGGGGEDGTGPFPLRARDSNGQICTLPGGGVVDGEDTRQQHPPAGWGVFDADGTQVGKLTATYFTGDPEPHGCAVDGDGRLFTAEVGTQGFGGARNGQLILWFPPYDTFPGPAGAYPDTDATSTNYCKLATGLGTAGSVAVDGAGRVYVAESSAMRVQRFSPPFPTGPDAARGCSGTDALGSPAALPSEVHRDVFIGMDLWQFLRGMWTLSGLAFAPSGNLYVSSVANGRIAEYGPQGRFLRFVMKAPQVLFPSWYGSPQGITVAPDGTVFYADLDLVWGWPPDPGPGANGKVWRVRSSPDGTPTKPEVVLDHLEYPDGVRVLPGDLQGGN